MSGERGAEEMSGGTDNRDYVNRPEDQVSESKPPQDDRAVEGTYACPICGCATPHAHSPEQIAEWRLKEKRLAFCPYCRGEVPFVDSERFQNSGGFWFHRGPNYSNTGEIIGCRSTFI
jgi:hypothetical protein